MCFCVLCTLLTVLKVSTVSIYTVVIATKAVLIDNPDQGTFIKNELPVISHMLDVCSTKYT